MNKSKFLKKSLAALLAILMVVAMIPLSAAAEEAPAPEGPKDPVVRVNNRPAVAQTAEDGSVSYAVTVPDATTVSVSWVPQDDYSAWLYTARKVSVKVPFNQLDLLQEGKVVEETETTVTYRVTFQVKAGDANANTPALKEYPLDVTVTTTVPNDDTTIKAVRSNQQFRIQNVDHSFLGIDSKIEGDVITITLPLGMSYAEAGFGDGSDANLNGATAGADFGQVNVKSAPNPADAIPGTVINANATTNNTVARRVFIPNSVYSTVKYVAPTTRTGDGRLTVTSRDGHSRNYTVKFVQEEVFSSLSVDGDSFATKTVDNQGVVTYTVPVPEARLAAVAADGTISYTFPTLENGAIKGNVVRVEDPRDEDGAYKGRYGWVNNTAKNSQDEPVRSGQNTFLFNAGTGADATSPTGTYYAYLTVKTRANMAPNATGVADKSFYQNIKIVLRPSTSADTSIALYEFQLNGYDSKWNKGEPLPTEFEYWVDYDFQFSEGDGQHPARVSGLVSGSHISIPDQDADVVDNDYWEVSKQEVLNNTRITKPNVAANGQPAGTYALTKVNTEGRVIVLRVWRGNDWKDYTITLRKPEQNKGTEVDRVKLYQRNADGSYTIHDSTKTTSRNFQFKLPNDLYDNDSYVASTLTPTWDPTGKAYAVPQNQGTPAAAAGDVVEVVLEADGNQLIKDTLDELTDGFTVQAASSGGNVTFMLGKGAGANQLDLIARVTKTGGATEDLVIASGDIASGIVVLNTAAGEKVATATVTGADTAATLGTLTAVANLGAAGDDFISGNTTDGGIEATFTLGAGTPTGGEALLAEINRRLALPDTDPDKISSAPATAGLQVKYDAATKKLALEAVLTGAGVTPTSFVLSEQAIADAGQTDVNFGDYGSMEFTATAGNNNITIDTLQTVLTTFCGTAAVAVTDAGDYTPVAPGADVTGASANWFTPAYAILEGGTYVQPTDATLNSTLASFLLVVDAPEGAVVTPGAQAKNGTKITDQVGVSLWGVGDGFTDQTWPTTSNVYTELEEGVTKLGDWWTSDYTVQNAGGDAFVATNDDTLYFTVRNGRDGDPQVYTITLAGHTNTTVLNAAADLVVGDNTYATSGMDEDLVYGGNDVTYSILSQNTNVVEQVYIAAATAANNGIGSTAIFDPNDAAYVNAVGGHNLYTNITIEPVATEANAHVITVHVPEDFGTGAADSANTIYFSGLKAADNANVYRVDTAGTDLTKHDASGSGVISGLNLNLSNQEIQDDRANKIFAFQPDMNAWSGDVFEPSNVDVHNILYVVSERDANGQPVPANKSGFRTEGGTLANQKYYITVRKDSYKTGDDLSSVSSNNNTSTSMNVAEKTVTVHVPNSYNWIGNRDNASHDFQLNFTTSEGALLIDAYQDARFGFRQVKDTNIADTYANFVTPDLQKKEQDAYKWVSEKNAAGEYNVNPTSFFVKDGELYIFNEDTGDEIQITGMGDEVNDRYIDSRWRLIMAKEAELRVYTEGRNNLNTYKLNLVIDDAIPDATITSLIVDETTATIDNTNRTATVSLPANTKMDQVKLSIAVSPLASIVKVGGEAYNPDDHNKTFNLTSPIQIVIAAEDDTEYTYTLSAGNEPVEPANAEITKLTVDSIEAEVNNTARTATVELPEGSDLSKVKLAIEVSEGGKLVSVAGEEFDAEAEYDLSSPIAIVIEAEDGTKYDYTLTGTVAKPVEPVNPADKYTDLDKIQKEETRDEVKKAINLGLMNGISESKGIFGVGMKMQRFQFALVVARADLREKLLAEDENADVTVNALDAKLVELYPDNYTFTDVSEKIELKAAAAAVQYCYDKGYINGKSLANKIFDPTGNITREEAAKIMVLWAGLEHEDTDVSAIPDGDQISNWAKGYVKAAADAGIMKGRTDGNFDPKGDLQRQDGACLLVRTYENYIVKADEDETPDDGGDDNDNNDGDDDTNNPGGDEDDTSKPDDDTSNPDQDGDEDNDSNPDDEDSSSTPDEDNESQPTE